MRLYEIIKMPTGDPIKYITNRMKEAELLLPVAIEIEQLSDIIDWEALDNTIYNMDEGRVKMDVFWRLKSTLTFKFVDYSLLKDIISYISDGLKANDMKFYMTHLLHRFENDRLPILEEDIIPALRQVGNSIELLQDYIDGDDATVATIVKNTIRLTNLLTQFIPKYNKFIANLSNKLETTYNPSSEATEFLGPQLPTHDDVEKLYHASAFAAQIEKEGFLPEVPSKRHGLGSFGRGERVSLTYDLYTAKEIARTLKEIHMISRGELRPEIIARWWQEENLDKKANEPLKDFIYKSIDQHLGNNEPSFLLLPNIGNVYKAASALNTEETAKLFKAYLHFSEKRFNPYYISIEDTVIAMKDVDIRDIGVLKVEVDMTDDPQYVPSEKEYRVEPDKILSVKRIL